MKGLNAILQLIDLHTEEVVMESESATGEGEYLVALPTDRDYALNVSADGYLFYSDHFSFQGRHSRKDPLRKNIPLERAEEGSAVVLNNIFFDTDSHKLKSTSVAELQKVIQFLMKNRALVVEISGHTDSTGNSDYNQVLSEKRAETVVDYLVAEGIPAERLIPAGYADRKPVADNATEMGRAMNRRTELRIIRVGPEKGD
jgi:outer membrane protein OmpA-like peptidoglycan-associated protein